MPKQGPKKLAERVAVKVVQVVVEEIGLQQQLGGEGAWESVV